MTEKLKTAYGDVLKYNCFGVESKTLVHEALTMSGAPDMFQLVL